MLGRWAPWYRGLEAGEPQSYGDTTTYGLAAEFLADCKSVADWGTGKGYFQTLRPDAIGVDGTDTPFADVVADLRTYRRKVGGILLRHVLEHNEDWREIMDNAAWSANAKLCIVLFTPLSDVTHEIARAPDIDVPDISFRLSDITERLAGFAVGFTEHDTVTQYGREVVIRAVRT